MAVYEKTHMSKVCKPGRYTVLVSTHIARVKELTEYFLDFTVHGDVVVLHEYAEKCTDHHYDNVSSRGVYWSGGKMYSGKLRGGACSSILARDVFRRLSQQKNTSACKSTPCIDWDTIGKAMAGMYEYTVKIALGGAIEWCPVTPREKRRGFIECLVSVQVNVAYAHALLARL